MSVIVVGATMAPYVAGNASATTSWLLNARTLIQTTKASTGHDVQFFCAFEIDARGLEPFVDVLEALGAIDGAYWTFSLDDNTLAVDSQNRLTRICTGRNLIQRYALNVGASHALFLDADVTVPVTALVDLLDCAYPFVGGHIPTYGLDGPPVGQIDMVDGSTWRAPDGHDLRLHWNTAGFLLVERSVLRRVQWRWDAEDGMTDDPCYAFDVQTQFGLPPLVDHAVVGRHYPETIPSIERRYSTEQRRFQR